MIFVPTGMQRKIIFVEYSIMPVLWFWRKIALIKVNFCSNLFLKFVLQFAPSFSVYQQQCGESPESGSSRGPTSGAPSVDPLARQADHEDRLELERLVQKQEANEAAFRNELAAFAKRQELAAEKERAVEHQRQLVADQAAALDTQRQALILQQQQLHEAQRTLELNRRAAALAQEQRERIQAAANIRAAAGLARQVAEENAGLEAALLEQQRRADELAAVDRVVRQQPRDAAAAEEEAQALEAAAEAARLVEQQRQLVVEAAMVLAQDAPVGLPAGAADPPVVVGLPAEAEEPAQVGSLN